MLENTPLPLVIILLGPPGSGKGTQAKQLAQDCQLPHISTGDLFRENISQGTELGKKVKGVIQAGMLVSDQLVLDMLFERVSKSDCQKGYLLDGFPRTIPQAEALSKALAGNCRMMALCLDVPDDVIVKRSAGRLLCKQCGAIYNRDRSPPKQEGVCDQCGGEVYQRPDDAPAVVQERLKVYHEQTEPLVRYYDERGLLTVFNGDQPPSAVYEELKRYIDSLAEKINF
jgi:adenylate kinase